MLSELFVAKGLVNQTTFANVLIDSGSNIYCLIDPSLVKRNKNMVRHTVKRTTIEAFDGRASTDIDEICAFNLDLDEYRERIWAYITPLGGHDMILGMPWLQKRDVKVNYKKLELLIDGIRVRSQRNTNSISHSIRQVSAAAFNTIASREKKNKALVFAASMADINKAIDKLNAKEKTINLQTLLPKQYHEYLHVFDLKEANKLPPHRDGVDHEIKINGEPPYGPLYSMSRDELLVLRKTLADYLDKGFIRVSSSPAGAPVLFVKKPGGGLRFCVDYRALNKLTVKDRYPLPLIRETLNGISKAKWFTKLDIIAAFHNIRIKEGDEPLTAFRTRFGSYEWLVTPFGLANAPSTFQRYINWILREYLDNFASAYIDDILIYSSGSLQDHRDKVKTVLSKLQEASLFVDVNKCEFETTSTKYLGFIIEAGKGIRMDPEKVKAITAWQAPSTLKGLRSFLGFANFYRRFIKGYSDITRPLTALTKSLTKFTWTAETQGAFDQLKRAFISEPILQQFDYDKATRIETDSSGWCVGGALLQPNKENVWAPCAFFSKKLSQTECNYPIYDKEMLAIIRCLEEWDAELRGTIEFEICSDHKNLEYFMTTRKLTERQVRWSLLLSKYNFQIRHIKGTDNVQADALSRRDQDLPDDQDDRVQAREIQLIKPEWIQKQGLMRVHRIRESTELIQRTLQPAEDGDIPAYATQDTIFNNWETNVQNDQDYQLIKEALRQNARKLPAELARLRLSITECTIKPDGNLYFRDRRWIPATENNLRTRLIQLIHDSNINIHPGRESLYANMAKDFFWPQMSADIRQFVANCDSCNANKASRQRRQGFLKPLPIPERIWSDISMDFIVDCPESTNYAGQVCTNIVVITDRLSKGVVAGSLPDIKIETLVNWFLSCYYPYHFLPQTIVSDRGSQFTSAFWKRLCDTLSIKRLLSTAFHPETDGATERYNEVIKTMLREIISWDQSDWALKLPLAASAMNGRMSRSTGVTPFFLCHGWNQSTIGTLDTADSHLTLSPRAAADRLIQKVKDTTEYIQATMAEAQQQQEEYYNRSKQQAYKYQVGDKVWLSLENIKTKRPKKGLDHRFRKYTVIEVMGSHTYRLDTPTGIHNVFHTKLLRPAATRPLPGQIVTEPQNPGIEVDGEIEYEVERIMGEKQGPGRSKRFLVKWAGYSEPTWEPLSYVQDLEALRIWRSRKKGRGG